MAVRRGHWSSIRWAPCTKGCRAGAAARETVAVNLNNAFEKCYDIPCYKGMDGSNYYGDPRDLMFTLKHRPKL